MPDYQALENRFQQILGLKRRPVAVAFRADVPEGTEKFSGSEPAGCSFWRLAAEGRTFSTVPSDHYNCPIGSYTHNIPLPEDRANELPAVLETMVSLGYLKMEEVAGIPVLPETPKNIVFAPLGDTAMDPDVVLFVADGEQAHASGRSGHSRRCFFQAPVARAAHLHGDPGGVGARHGDQRRLHRQSRLHSHRRRRSVRRGSWTRIGTNRARAGDRGVSQSGAGAISSRTPGVAFPRCDAVVPR